MSAAVWNPNFVRKCSAPLMTLTMVCAALSATRAEAAKPLLPVPSASEPTTTPSVATTVAGPSPDDAATIADANATELCRGVRFAAYSTLSPDGPHFEESVSWDDRSKSYLIRGPILGMILDYPGLSMIPMGDSAPQYLFRIAIRAELSPPINRFCEYGFQERGDCDAHGDIIYTQIYTDCELQTLRHVVMLTPDQAGTVPLLAVRRQDVRGVYSNHPVYLWGGSDLRLR